MSGGPPAGPEALCRLDALADPGSAAVVVERAGTRQSIMVLRKDGQVYGYLNVCPHVGAPLDWHSGHFLDADKRLVLCTLHGALFRIEDGLCVGGPCAGKALTPVPLRLDGDTVRIEMPNGA